MIRFGIDSILVNEPRDGEHGVLCPLLIKKFSIREVIT